MAWSENAGQVLALLAAEDNGEYLIRPSASGMDKLTITRKVPPPPGARGRTWLCAGLAMQARWSDGPPLVGLGRACRCAGVALACRCAGLSLRWPVVALSLRCRCAGLGGVCRRGRGGLGRGMEEVLHALM